MGEVFGSIVGTGVGFFSKFDDEMTVREYLTDFIVRNRHWPNCTADDLTLFLAKWNGKWLHHQDLDYLEMRKCDIPDGIKETMNDANRMSPERRLKDFDFPGPDECGGIGALVLLHRLNMIESRYYLYALADLTLGSGSVTGFGFGKPRNDLGYSRSWFKLNT